MSSLGFTAGKVVTNYTASGVAPSLPATQQRSLKEIELNVMQEPEPTLQAPVTAATVEGFFTRRTMYGALACGLVIVAGVGITLSIVLTTETSSSPLLPPLPPPMPPPHPPPYPPPYPPP